MARLFARYWMDVEIGLKKCGEYCKKHFTNPIFSVPDDLKKFLKIRPEPFVKGEVRVAYHANADTTSFELEGLEKLQAIAKQNEKKEKEKKKEKWRGKGKMI